MLYMIIEKFYPRKVKNLYKRFEEKSRLMPEGLTYINSWVAENLSCVDSRLCCSYHR